MKLEIVVERFAEDRLVDRPYIRLTGLSLLFCLRGADARWPTGGNDR